MSARYALDTNIVSEPTRRAPDRRVLDLLDAHSGHLAIGSIVWHELRYGVQRLPRGARQTRLYAYLEEVVIPSMVILPYDLVAADWHAAERARLVGLGRTASFADGQIAAIAATRDLTLVTRNVRDFEAFDGLRIENWFTD